MYARSEAAGRGNAVAYRLLPQARDVWSGAVADWDDRGGTQQPLAGIQAPMWGICSG